jgi:hypothetical protein
MIVLLTWSLTALALLVVAGLIAVGIELNRRDYQAYDRAAEIGGAVVSFPLDPDGVEDEQLRAA